MTQQEFLNSLQQALEKYGVDKVSDILGDYREHFTHGLSIGKTEEEIAAKLGNPLNIAKAYETDSLIAKVRDPDSNFQWETAFRVIGRLILLAPFNLVVIFIPGAIVFSFVVAGWSVATGLTAACFGIFAVAGKVGLLGFSSWTSIAVGSASMAVLGAGVLFAIVMFLLTKWILLALISYLQWNLKFVMEK
jgi:uncharacterized membrane protein